MKTVGPLFILLVLWLLGVFAGYYMGLTEVCARKPPAKVRYSYVDTVPPPCVLQPTRDLRHACEWSRVHQPPVQPIKQPRGGAQ